MSILIKKKNKGNKYSRNFEHFDEISKKMYEEIYENFEEIPKVFWNKFAEILKKFCGSFE